MTNFTDNMPKVRTDATPGDAALSDSAHSPAIGATTQRQRMTFKDLLRAVQMYLFLKLIPYKMM